MRDLNETFPVDLGYDPYNSATTREQWISENEYRRVLILRMMLACRNVQPRLHRVQLHFKPRNFFYRENHRDRNVPVHAEVQPFERVP